MTTETRAPLRERLEGLAMQMAYAAIETNNAPLQDYAYAVAEFARQLDEEYVRIHGIVERDTPTLAQGIALARFLRPAFADYVHPGDRHAHVSRGGAGLPADYVHVRHADGYEGGIDPEGRVST